MEKSVRLLNFETLDQMIQVHDYDGVSLMGGRDANQKAAAGEATNIFQNHYPEFLVSLSVTILVRRPLTVLSGSQVLHQRSHFPHLDLLGLQDRFVCQDLLQVGCRRHWQEHYCCCPPSRHRHEGAAEEIWWRG